MIFAPLRAVAIAVNGVVHRHWTTAQMESWDTPSFFASTSHPVEVAVVARLITTFTSDEVVW